MVTFFFFFNNLNNEMIYFLKYETILEIMMNSKGEFMQVKHPSVYFFQVNQENLPIVV